MNKTFEILILIIYLAVVFTLVRPGSQGPSFIKALGDGLAGIITAATGAGAWGPSSGAAPQQQGPGSGTVYA